MNHDKIDFGLLVDKYIKIRDKKSQLQKARDAEIAKYTDALDEIERLLLAECNEMGVESLRTSAGTAYKTVKHSVTVADKDAFRNFIKNEDAWYFADLRANAPAVRAYLDENDHLPPGVNMSSWAAVNVKR